jgi:ribosomal protein S18 acetylase RimI-like enzyme
MPAEPETGPRIVVRKARDRDGESVGRFLIGLSLASRNQRFFGPIHYVTPDLVRALIDGTPGRLIFLALECDSVVGHVMAVHASDDVVDIGIVVAEAYQYRGIGRRLVNELAGALTACGMTRVRCDVLSGNYFVLDWLRRLLPDIRFERDHEMMTVHGTLTTHSQ